MPKQGVPLYEKILDVMSKRGKEIDAGSLVRDIHGGTTATATGKIQQTTLNHLLAALNYAGQVEQTTPGKWKLTEAGLAKFSGPKFVNDESYFTEIGGANLSQGLSFYDYKTEGVGKFVDDDIILCNEKELDQPLVPQVKSLRIAVPSNDESTDFETEIKIESEDFLTYKNLFESLSKHLKDVDLSDHNSYEGLRYDAREGRFAVNLS